MAVLSSPHDAGWPRLVSWAGFDGCEPAPPQVDTDGYARAADQWRIRMGADGIPQFVPPESYAAEPRPGSVGSRSVPGSTALYALSLFDDGWSLGEADRAGELARAGMG
jgi:hypothetical protein